MATVIPPHGGTPALVLKLEEAQELLALLIANPRQWNNSLREKLVTYIARIPAS
jgi:hypothetical protein